MAVEGRSDCFEGGPATGCVERKVITRKSLGYLRWASAEELYCDRQYGQAEQWVQRFP